MTPLIWTHAARKDLERHYSFLAKQNVTAAKQAMHMIVYSARLLQQSPRIGVVMEDRLRREHSVSYASSGYVLRYLLDKSGNIVILRVYHQKEHR